MNFTVVWKPDAEDQLAQIWLDAEHRDAVSAAANHIERALRTTPLTLGESRNEQTRVVVVPPLAVHFEVRNEDRIVFVLTVHQFSPSSKGE